MVLTKIARVFGGDPHKREIEKLAHIVDEINHFEAALEKLSNDELSQKTVDFRQRLAEAEQQAALQAQPSS